MVDHPRLIEDAPDEWLLGVSLADNAAHNFADPSREEFHLTTRATALLVDDLEYAHTEEVADETARALLLTEGAYRPDEKANPADTIQRLEQPSGGKHPTDAELERVADYLRNAEIDERAEWITEEFIEESRLESVVSPDELQTKRNRMNSLRGIAKDL
ncbi:uncharacterized protein NP_2660A [Natronomonas pharaonis DSM 2160]|uniref:Uncharacterized protein n=1 Tax=Natronomonas pharaonis (strain ATCC 35678 / DSM 2160 / CIP 103997 / JCM 8858 / NBRC 14720 / NCIMB 2260 / Gabara) TaxID=348780 RepID=A0A1U7EWF9_NATPD|nr:hypothetical protein [Natronomonas pharaonis]CAI49421.1 uncharacterized protein NP_2660A [Natronomonas pharaonis DSM 2160]